jgi:hypothetical protein
MSNCNNDGKCINGIQPSHCIEYDENFSVKDKIKSIDEKLSIIDNLFNKTVDGKTLATGQDLTKTVQKLVDESIKKNNNVKETSSTLDYSKIDLSCLTGESCNAVMTNEEIISFLVKEVCFLKNKLMSISTNY